MTDPVREFIQAEPTQVTHWRSIVLFGRNSASYKFAFGKSLLEVAGSGRDQVSLEELAVPYAKHICRHLESVDRQSTATSSQFLDACRAFLRDGNEDALRVATAKRGFTEVLEAFHQVAGDEIPTRFFEVERSRGATLLRLTADTMNLAAHVQAANLSHEIEARWRLVETAWSLDLPRIVLDGGGADDGQLSVVLPDRRRKAVTGCREALNGYQRGRCFYCATDIQLAGAHVDHFLPHTLMVKGVLPALDAVWNLVLACPSCNSSKSARLPHEDYARRLLQRIEYLIGSHHPLRETLIDQTGKSQASRRAFVEERWRSAGGFLHHPWRPDHELPAPW